MPTAIYSLVKQLIAKTHLTRILFMIFANDLARNAALVHQSRTNKTQRSCCVGLLIGLQIKLLFKCSAIKTFHIVPLSLCFRVFMLYFVEFKPSIAFAISKLYEIVALLMPSYMAGTTSVSLQISLQRQYVKFCHILDAAVSL